MATSFDSEKAIVDLLTSNWNDANTDGITPTISKIFQQPKTLDMDKSRDYILVFNPTTNEDFVGIGEPTKAEVNNMITLDVRSLGKFDDTQGIVDDGHVRKVLAEVRRILYSNVNNPASGWDFLDATGDLIEQNDRYRGIFRYIKNINLVSRCRDQTA